MRFMRRALELAAKGQGLVEPNPMVGCVIASGEQILGEGWHRQFGGPHAEVEALRAATANVDGATLYVTLEPCAHHGKTPPCVEAILGARPARVVVAMLDPFPEVSGRGVEQLRPAGIRVDVGLCEQEARTLNAPYLTLIERGRPWVIAKWAMTLDGKLATRTGSSRWISGSVSRQRVHALRRRVDGILVGSRTARLDDPLLTARPPGPRTATRIVLDSRARLAGGSKLIQTAAVAPVLVACGPQAAAEDIQRLQAAGCQVWGGEGDRGRRLEALLAELGRRRMTNLLVEGGAYVLGAFFDRELIDEVQVFVAPKLVGGEAASSPVGGRGLADMTQAFGLETPTVEILEGDVLVRGRVARTAAAPPEPH